MRAFARRRALRVVTTMCFGAGVLFACSRSGDRSRLPPTAEFLFAAGDSTYWVNSSAEGIRVRSAPILLTEVDGHFYEIFVAEDGVEYSDASFTSSRIWSRELLHSDSTLLFEDSTVMHEATAWKKRHPRDVPIDLDDQQAANDPRTVVNENIEIVDVHGPYLTYRHLLDVDVDVAEPHRHEGSRAVVDVRSGQRATLTGLFGAVEAARVVLLGRASLAKIKDSVQKANDARALAARETLDSFHFDSASFGITDISRAPAVAFLVPGTGSDGDALAVYLPPIAIAAPTWWSGVRPSLPDWTVDSSRVHWNRGAYDVVARPLVDGNTLKLGLSAHTLGPSREWPIASVASPAYQLITLDAPSVSTQLRAALARAFDVSTTLDGIVQRAQWLRHHAIDSLHGRPYFADRRTRRIRRAPDSKFSSLHRGALHVHTGDTNSGHGRRMADL